jgi:spore germination cell wall hydrolase CwlJ-like protein
MGLKRLMWAFNAVAPWCVAAALVVSFTAEAGQEVLIGVTRAAAAHPGMPDDLVPAVASERQDSFGIAAPASAGLITPASLVLGAPEELDAIPDEDQPRLQLKRSPNAFPLVDRHSKGNPFIGLRPSFETKLERPAGLERLRRFAILFAAHDRDPAPSVLLPSDDAPPGPEAVSSFEGAPKTDTTTVAAAGIASPMSAAAGLTGGAPAGPAPRTNDGSSPVVPRAVGLGSTTPTAADAMPVEVDAMLRLPGQDPGVKGRPGAPNMTIVARDGGIVEQPDYLSLISGDNLEREQQCLAQAIYFEARSEPAAGQAAVAQVVLNRVASGLYPSTVCGVVYQNAQHYLGCQFSFACEGKSLRITEPEPWAVAQRIAREVIEGSTYMAGVGGATHYHAKYVNPPWAHQLMKMDVIGQHIFYKLKPGQS